MSRNLEHESDIIRFCVTSITMLIAYVLATVLLYTCIKTGGTAVLCATVIVWGLLSADYVYCTLYLRPGLFLRLCCVVGYYVAEVVVGIIAAARWLLGGQHTTHGVSKLSI